MQAKPKKNLKAFYAEHQRETRKRNVDEVINEKRKNAQIAYQVQECQNNMLQQFQTNQTAKINPFNQLNEEFETIQKNQLIYQKNQIKQEKDFQDQTIKFNQKVIKQNYYVQQKQITPKQQYNPFDQYKENSQNIGDYMIFKNQILGKGSFSTVYRGQSNKLNGKSFAIKQILMRNTNFKNVEQEIQIMKEIQCKNIVRIFDAFLDQSQKNCYIILEYCNQGSLLDFQLKQLNTKQKLQFFQQILYGMKELHQRNIIHRDLKLANILVSNNECKIADFGFAKFLDPILIQESIKCGTPSTMAPEVQFHANNTLPYNNKCDIWSLGVILHELIYDCHPFNYDIKQIKFGQRIKVQNPIEIVEDFLNKALQMDPDNRMDWKEIFQHPLFTGKQQIISENQKKNEEQKNLKIENQQIFNQELKNINFQANFIKQIS